MVARSCPSCAATTVFDGRIIPGEQAGAVRFEPLGSYGVSLRVGFHPPTGLLWCTTCGLVWAKVPPEALRACVHAQGGLAWDYLQAIELGPAHDLPDCPEACQAGERVAEIDALVLDGRQPEATRRYRELMGVTWDQAIDDVRRWRERSRAEKLAKAGWTPKPGPSANDCKAAGDPMHDPQLDGA